MGKYQDVHCPICEEPLENGEVIVICPDCGAPYHRDCVVNAGKCIYTDLHETHKSWELPKKEMPFAGNEPKRCTRCGTINPINGLFCEVCGTPLNPPETDEDAPTQQQHSMVGQNQQQMHGQQMPPHQMAYNPFTTPFGGVNPDESIDGIPVRDWAIYIGQNTQYFIPKFKDFSESKRTSSFNFAAAVFRGFYYLFRKMYLWGIIFLFVTLLLSIPSVLLTVDYLRESMFQLEKMFTNDAGLIMMSNICSFLSLVLFFASGMLTNRLYKMHCFHKISKIRTEITEHNAYVEKLTRSGSVSRKLIMILLFSYLGFNIVMAMLMTFQMIK